MEDGASGRPHEPTSRGGPGGSGESPGGASPGRDPTGPCGRPKEGDMNSLTRGGVLLLGALAGIGLGAGEAHAQVGLKAGLSHGSISNTGVLPGDLGGRTGFAAGLSFGTGYETPLGIGIELLYAQRGSEEPNNPSSRELDYIDIPAYVRLAIPAGSVQPF